MRNEDVSHCCFNVECTYYKMVFVLPSIFLDFLWFVIEQGKEEEKTVFEKMCSKKDN